MVHSRDPADPQFDGSGSALDDGALQSGTVRAAPAADQPPGIPGVDWSGLERVLELFDRRDPSLLALRRRLEIEINAVRRQVDFLVDSGIPMSQRAQARLSPEPGVAATEKETLKPGSGPRSPELAPPSFFEERAAVEGPLGLRTRLDSAQEQIEELLMEREQAERMLRRLSQQLTSPVVASLDPRGMDIPEPLTGAEPVMRASLPLETEQANALDEPEPPARQAPPLKRKPDPVVCSLGGYSIPAGEIPPEELGLPSHPVRSRR